MKGNDKTRIVGRLNSKAKKWTILGQMQTARESHSAIFYDSYFLVMGGLFVQAQTEVCQLVNDQILCMSQNYELSYYWNREAFIVPFDFCQ